MKSYRVQVYFKCTNNYWHAQSGRDCNNHYAVQPTTRKRSMRRENVIISWTFPITVALTTL